MRSAASVRRWYLIHKWTSVICTVFLLMLCITGFPLIFHHEIHDWSDTHKPAEMPAATPRASVDRVASAALALRAGYAIQFVFWDPDKPDEVMVSLAPSVTATRDIHVARFDARTTALLGSGRADDGVMAFIFKLHVDMFAGLPGKLFLGLMGLLFIASLISGIVVYGPFMRKLEFGTVRRKKSLRLRWLDLHNLLGVATVAWMLVVGATGVLNTWADVVIKIWQFEQLGAMVAPYKDLPPLRRDQYGSLQAALQIAQQTTPGMKPSFIAYPGSQLSSQHHYAVFMRGITPLTARLLKPVLVDAQTGTLTASRALPWYVTLLLLSQPLHFGDYGGLPLKLIWAILDLITVTVLGSGLYLWLGRRHRPLGERVAEDNAGSASDDSTIQSFTGRH